MHEEEVEVDDALVLALLDSQAPSLVEGRALARIDAWGTEHAIFRLGDDLSVRLPKIGWAAAQGERERRWLPVLAPSLPVAVPVPVFVGEPAFGYPYRWYVSPWLDGTNPSAGALDPGELASFVHALERVAVPVDAPVPRPAQRGGPLEPADVFTRRRAEDLRILEPDLDVDAVLRIWDAGFETPGWDGAPVWVHGDLMDGNLLVRDGRLVGVIDWGGLTAGDPAVELMICWSYFDAAGRAAYRDALGFVDDAMWLRGRAWAVSAAVQALPYYRDTNPDIVARSWRAVRAALASEPTS